MKKEKLSLEESEYVKLQKLLSVYEKLLHPDVFQPILKQVKAAYDEAKAQGYRDANITEEALEIERIMKGALGSMKIFRNSDTPISFYCKTAFKQILPLFKKFLNEKERADCQAERNTW